MEAYQKEYKAFLASFKEVPVSGTEVGEIVAVMADHYSDYNLAMIESLRRFNMVKKVCSEEKDANDKQVSIAKAEVMADATPEAADFERARGHVQNLDAIIGALKTMQRGLVNEYQRVS